MISIDNLNEIIKNEKNNDLNKKVNKLKKDEIFYEQQVDKFIKYLDNNLDKLLINCAKKKENSILITSNNADVIFKRVNDICHYKIEMYAQILEKKGFIVKLSSSQGEPSTDPDWWGYAPINNYMTISWNI